MQSLDEARNADAIDEKKFLFLRTHKIVLDSLMDITKGDYARFNSSTYLEVYEDIQEKAQKKYKDEVAAHGQTQKRLEALERSSSDEIEALKARISSMEENERKRQEDNFNKMVSRWGWIVTLIFAGIPYLLLVVGIEISKTQFADRFVALGLRYSRSSYCHSHCKCYVCYRKEMVLAIKFELS